MLFKDVYNRIDVWITNHIIYLILIGLLGAFLTVMSTPMLDEYIAEYTEVEYTATLIDFRVMKTGIGGYAFYVFDTDPLMLKTSDWSFTGKDMDGDRLRFGQSYIIREKIGGFGAINGNQMYYEFEKVK